MIKGDLRSVVCRTNVQFARMVEAAILPFPDGRLYLAYSEGERADHIDGGMPEGNIRIMGRWSPDEGESWSAPFVVKDFDGTPNAMEPSFLHLTTGQVLQTFMERATYTQSGDSFAGMRILKSYSDNDCATWSEPEEITDYGSMFFTTNDRLLSLSTGRVILPAVIGPNLTSVRAWLSDDQGISWRAGTGAVHAPQGISYGYPIAAELSDGRVALFLVNSTGRMHIAQSNDGGETWSEVDETGIEPCPAPFMVRRLPASTDLLLVWNHHTQRTNLSIAISHDDAQSWTTFRVIEAQDRWPLERTWCYPSLAFMNNYAHLTYYERSADPTTKARFDLIYRRLPLDSIR